MKPYTIFFWITAPLLILAGLAAMISPDSVRKNAPMQRMIAFLFFSKDPRSPEAAELTNKQIYIYAITAIVFGLLSLVLGVYA
ncbi:MAG TPA: hypothetical protein PKH77_27170 [Anaerolineae bacterium]|nr:hypothetical protein [Anaerolineae bacterium]